MPRLFVALPVPPVVRSRLAAVQEELGAAGLPFRWSRRDGLHVTLVFVGERPAQDVPLAAGAIERAVAGRQPIPLTLAGLGGFPALARPRVLWAGLRGDPASLDALQRAVARELRAAGVPFDRRPFRPHVTLGRASGALAEGTTGALQAAAHAAGANPWGTWTAAEVHLMESQLRPGGAVYTAVARAPLGLPDGGAGPDSQDSKAPQEEPDAAGAAAPRREEAVR